MVRRKLDIVSLEPTPREVFFDRRRFIGAASAGVAGIAGIAAAAPVFADDPDERILKPPLQRPGVFPAKRNEAYTLPPGQRADLTPRLAAATHNNFYEFLPGKGGPAWEGATKFEVDPWKIEVTGECKNPMTLDLDALFAFPHEERVYHFRCVERWAMNVPWSGFPLKLLIDQAQPTEKARFLRFESASKPDQMPGIREAHWYPWPYHEALRMDEATNELAMVVTGVYGEPLLKQHGAPVRIVVPWKYGYKNPKSIVKIEFVEKPPMTFWMMQRHEYGFLSNVNPNIPHPRWSQGISYWLDTQEPFRTQMFNGYDAQVAALYPDEPRTPQEPLREGQIAR
jgi:sulfoxide reductase catalytic subunit YedY